MMTQAEYIKYLRDQSFWINQLIEDIESGKDQSEWCSWCVDLVKKPEIEKSEDKLAA